MRVLLVTQYFWPERFPINEVVRRLASEGVNLDVLTGQPNYPEGRTFAGRRWYEWGTEQFDGITVFRVPLVPRGRSGRVGLALNYLSFVLSGCLVGPFLTRKRSYDVVFAYLPSPILSALPALLLGRKYGAKVMLWIQDLWPGSVALYGARERGLLMSALEHTVRWIYRRCDEILISSEGFREPVEQLLAQPEALARGKVSWFPNSYDPGFSPVSDVRRDLPEFDCEYPVVFAGNVGRAQAIHTILDASRLLRDETRVRFYLVGSGSMLEYARERIRSEGLHNVVLTGAYPSDSMPEILLGAGALLLTLSSDDVLDRTIPSRLQAYLWAGRPILCAASGDVGRLIESSGAGLTCASEDSAGLARLVVRLLEMPEGDRARLGQAGRRYFEAHFDPVARARELRDRLQASSR